MIYLEIIKASSAGFCFGVANAVKKAYELAQDKKCENIYSYGSLIHNDAVVKELEEMGVRIIKTLDDSIRNSCVIIRAHGVAPDIYSRLEELNCTVVDATCPYVKKIHTLVHQRYLEGNKIIIVGDKTHPEVIGINGWCDNTAIIVETEEECKSIQDNGENWTIVSQTTFNKKIFEIFKNIFKKGFDKLNIFDTICNATSIRQKETMEIASKVDLMVVIGGHNSSNTQKLYEISKDLCNNVLLVESADDIDLRCLENIYKVGVTAGASTPDWIIGEVIGIMSDDVKSIENEVVSEETTQAYTEDVINEAAVGNEVADNVEDSAVKEENADNSFATMLEETLTNITSGQVVKGPISKIDVKGVYIDLGFKYEGFISIDEFAEVPGFEIEQLNIGDIVEAMVVKVSDKDCEAILSKRRVDYKKNLQLLEDSFENKTPVTVRFTEVVKGGLIAHLGTIRVFIPGSQVSDRFIKDISTYVGKSDKIVITSFEKGPRGKMRIVGSRRTLVEEEKAVKEENFWGKIEEGKTYTGTVKSFTPFGAFVDLGGYDGLIHLTELSWKRVRHPQEVLKIGQSVEVKVIECDREKKRISLGYRKPEDNPWYDAENLYQVGDILEVTVVRFVKFGVFVNIKDGIDGLVHISQISNKRIEKAEDCLKIGQKVMAKIIDTNIPEKRINLSIRDVQPFDPEPKQDENEEEKPSVPKADRKPRKKVRKTKPAETSNNGVEYAKSTNLNDNNRLASTDVTPSTTTIGDILASKMQELTGSSEEEKDEE